MSESTPGVPEEQGRDGFMATKYEAQNRVFDLYSERLLTQDEAVVFLKKISGCNRPEDLRAFEDDFVNDPVYMTHEEGKIYDDIIKLDQLENGIQNFSEGLDIENWGERLVELLMLIKKLDLQDYHALLVKSWLASFLERIYNLYLSKKTDIHEFGDQLSSILSSYQSEAPQFLEADRGEILGKRQPDFFESVDGTIERLYVVDQFEKYIREFAQGMIVGGSMSYGPFFNIRKGLDETGSSDIDLIIILEQEKLGTAYWEKLARSNMFSAQEMQVFFNRLSGYRNLLEKGEADIFSHKFHVQDQNFEISVHIFSPAVFEDMVGGEFSQQLAKGHDGVHILRDFKNKEYPYQFCNQQDFSGEIHCYQVPPQPKVDGGVIASLPSYEFHDGHFFPGVYHNLISPKFSTHDYSGGEVSEQVRHFRELVEMRFGEEKKSNPSMRLHKSHIRHRVFSPDLISKFS